ncbi:ABC transporter ATP-binding protein [Paenibacillus sp.]|uniref:ABC transporter ATP-binding protein n=1 Tax=Paenibacillus sp. TaxID=58172 RepID=UPI0035CCE055
MLVPFVSIYMVMAELLHHAADVRAVGRGHMLWWAVAGVVGLGIGFLLMYIGGMASHVAAFRILYGLRVKLSDHIGKLSLGFFNRNASGKIKKIMVQDVEQIEKFIAHQLPDFINTVVMVLVMVVVMFMLNPWLALACLLPIVLGFAAQFSMMMGREAKAGMKEYFDALEKMSASAVQYVRGMPSIKVFGQTVHSFRAFHKQMTDYRDFSVQYTDKFQHGYVAFRVLLLSLSTFILPVGVFLLSRDPQQMAFALVLILFLVLSPGISVPIFKLGTLAQTLGSIEEGIRRIDRFFAEPAIPENEKGGIPVQYDVVYEGVSFAYDAEAGEVLKEVSFTAHQGQITALVGPSGSGKSTLAQLLPRFWDVGGGAIRIGGIDIRDMRMEQLMSTVSFVFQDSFLFTDTLFNNIRIGRPEATLDEVLQAAKAAQCHTFIERLPQGYDTLIGQGGTYLSGGEEQRVSVARAILKNAPILVLDEATAYADPENEHHMQQALKTLIQDKTVIVIAHRLTTIRDAANIVVLSRGSVEEQGTHDELVQAEGLYCKMWAAYTAASHWTIGKEEVTYESTV